MVSQIVEYNVSDAKISEMKEKYMVLKLTDVNDMVGFNKIVEYRKSVKSIRVEVEQKRKSLKAESLAYGRVIDSEAKRITQLILPIEKHLIEQEDVVKKEKERIKAEKQAEIDENHRKRITLIVGSGATFNGSHYVFGDSIVSEVDTWNYSEEEFSLKITEIKLWKKLEDIKAAEETKKRLEEEARLAEVAKQQKKEQDRLDKIAKEQAEQARKLEEAQNKIDEENRKREEKIRGDEARKLAEFEAEKKSKAMEEKKAALLPEKEKLLTLAEKFISPNLPVLNSKEGKIIIENIKTELKALGLMVKDSASEL